MAPKTVCLRGHDTYITGRWIANRKCIACANENDRFRKTGCSPEQYQELNRKQNGLCAICFQKDITGLSVDHDHKTKNIRGLLCHTCSLALGNAKDSPNLLRDMATYLENRTAFAATNISGPKS